MSELYSLYKLHKVDAAMHSLRREAASLDTGEDEAKRLKSLAKEHEEVGGHAKELHAQQVDRELQQKSFKQKIDGYNKKLYDGSVVSPREIENIEKEISMLKELSDQNDEKLLELYDQVPPAVAAADKLKAEMDAMEVEIKAKRERAVARHAEIKAEYEALKAQRLESAAEVGREMREKYEETRKRTGDVAMAEVTEEGRCSQCGMAVPTKQSKMLDDDRLVACEGCHRILFKAVATG